MKTKHFLFIGSLFVLSFFVACGGSKHEGHDHENSPEEVVVANYACPMHTEITGKEGDRCTKCGMLLTEVKPIERRDSTEMN